MKKIIVIGAGIVGASTAYHLTKLGADVIVIDREELMQATNASAGIIAPWIAQRRNKAWYFLARNGAKFYSELVCELEKDGQLKTGYKKVGSINLFTQHEKVSSTKERLLKRRTIAPEIGDVSVLQPDEVRAKFPLIEDDYYAIYISGAARVDGKALKNSLIQSAKKNGAKFISGDAQILNKHGQVVGVNVNNETIEADTVIAATGAWTQQLFDPLGISLNVFPQKGQIIHLQLPNSEVTNWPVIKPPNDQYILSLDTNRIIIGATRESHSGFDSRVTAGGVNKVLSSALQYVPGLADATIVETRVGFRPFTPNSLPVIGSIPNLEGLYLANGLGASGLTTGPFIGLQLAKLALNMKLDIELSDYDVTQIIRKLDIR